MLTVILGGRAIGGCGGMLPQKILRFVPPEISFPTI